MSIKISVIRVIGTLFVGLGCLSTVPVFAFDHASQVGECIAVHSGAGSVECLESIMLSTEHEIHQMERLILSQLKGKLRADELTLTHYKLAESALHKASQQYEQYCVSQCDFSVGAKGAVASGSQQVRYSCRIMLNDQRIEYLHKTLLEIH